MPLSLPLFKDLAAVRSSRNLSIKPTDTDSQNIKGPRPFPRGEPKTGTLAVL